MEPTIRARPFFTLIGIFIILSDASFAMNSNTMVLRSSEDSSNTMAERDRYTGRNYRNIHENPRNESAKRHASIESKGKNDSTNAYSHRTNTHDYRNSKNHRNSPPPKLRHRFNRSHDHGMNAGKKVGLFFVGIAGVFQVGAAVFLLFKRKQFLETKAQHGVCS
ncbi:hypothetical protein AMTRI_Chr04g243050 [Amborella trichopoda]|uniref:Transmembrane protein n=1 Tax=Amborella trichopoda TaxID=13333 RepID=W1PMK2_AMBTC|nr:uncharacterized protein LOC18439423 [Amborella trichopoda]ERN11232.1 hypothetical protein AMTR_s00024p00228340 [Amborella trichopoda]|eukprot:XP_006849651.1 uncharacterized protein LOC18439423 [Amborella trichopoda]